LWESGATASDRLVLTRLARPPKVIHLRAAGLEGKRLEIQQIAENYWKGDCAAGRCWIFGEI